MELKIAQPLGFSRLGSRTNNEDTIFPDPAQVSPRQRWFMVCDGVGGVDRGEVASYLTARYLDEFFGQNPVGVAMEEFIANAVLYAEAGINAYLRQNPDATGMATTLTLLYLHEAGATVAHVGDSRVYHVRQGRIEWRTDDHSYVNDLVKAGIITPDEARQHPQRNVITRAIQGGDKPAQPAVQLIQDLRPGDYFLLCSDGILERVSDELLENILSPQEPNQEKIKTLLSCCEGHTRDNFSAYLIEIKAVDGGIVPTLQVEKPTYERPEEPETPVVALVVAPPPAPVVLPHPEPRFLPPEPLAVSPPVAFSPPPSAAPARQVWWAYLLVLVMLGAGAYFVWARYYNPLQERRAGVAPAVRQPTPRPALTPKIATSPPATPQTADSSLETALATADETTLTLPEKPRVERSEAPRIERRLNKFSIAIDANGLRGLLKPDDKTWLGPERFSKIGPFVEGLAEATLDGSTVYLSVDSGHWFDERREKSNGRILVKNGAVYSFLNLNGQSPFKYNAFSSAKSFANGTAEVVRNGKTEYIDTDGRVVQAPR